MDYNTIMIYVLIFILFVLVIFILFLLSARYNKLVEYDISLATTLPSFKKAYCMIIETLQKVECEKCKCKIKPDDYDYVNNDGKEYVETFCPFQKIDKDSNLSICYAKDKYYIFKQVDSTDNLDKYLGRNVNE